MAKKNATQKNTDNVKKVVDETPKIDVTKEEVAVETVEEVKDKEIPQDSPTSEVEIEKVEATDGEKLAEEVNEKFNNAKKETIRHHLDTMFGYTWNGQEID